MADQEKKSSTADKVEVAALKGTAATLGVVGTTVGIVDQAATGL